MHDFTRISLEDASNRLLQHIKSISETEAVPLLESVDRICAESITALTDQPPFDRSPLDGYALRSVDSIGASKETPVFLQVIGQINAGDPPYKSILPGQAVRIMTGAPIPAGADCVIRQEITNYSMGTVQIFTELSPHENFCFKGEDVFFGDSLLEQGQRIDWTHIGILAMQGMAVLPVFRRPKVGLLTTGDELTAANMPLRPGKIYDSNGPLLSARLQKLGAVPILSAHCADDPAGIADEIKELSKQCDFILTTGGVSVGARDYLPSAAELLHAEILFHGLDAKPGSPTMAMLFNETPILSLSGNPFAATAMFEILGRPVIERLSGHIGVYPQRIQAPLRGDFLKPSASRRLIRGRFTNNEVIIPSTGHSSGMLSKFVGCNCLVDIPAGNPRLISGSIVSVLIL